MFEEFGPENPPLPPAGALEQAIHRGRTIRRRRRAGVISAVTLSAVVIGGFALANPFPSNQAVSVPADPAPAPDYAPIPLSTPPTPPPESGLDFGKLSGITTAPDGVITLHVDRQKFTTGAEVQQDDGGAPRDYALDDPDGDQDLTFTLDPKASVQATASLSSNGEEVEDLTRPETLTVDELVARFEKLELPAVPDPDTDRRPLVWLRHYNGSNGPVTAIVDQFTP